MSQNQANFLLKAWYQWKSLRLPWRKRIFVGADPQGNTYYILHQPRGDSPPSSSSSPNSSPARRLVHYPRSTPYSEVKVPPAWHSWLRYQRAEPPSMEEQVAELQRQARIKLLAAEADARWEAKGSLLDMPASPPSAANKPRAETTDPDPREQRVVPESERADRQEKQGGTRSSSNGGDQGRDQGARDPGERGKKKPSPDNDPWKQAQRGAPGETWQPQAWTPTSTPARRR